MSVDEIVSLFFGVLVITFCFCFLMFAIPEICKFQKTKAIRDLVLAKAEVKRLKDLVMALEKENLVCDIQIKKLKQRLEKEKKNETNNDFNSKCIKRF